MDSGMVQERSGEAGVGVAVVSDDDCCLAVEDSLTRTEIDLRERVIRKAWKLLGFAHARTYELNAPATVQIREKSRLLEGYTIASFDVIVSVQGGRIRMWSAGDFESARLMRERIEKFLKGNGRGCPGDAKPSAGR